jgi:hypothetical protein
MQRWSPDRFWKLLAPMQLFLTGRVEILGCQAGQVHGIQILSRDICRGETWEKPQTEKTAGEFFPSK